jgi:putative membrane protein
MPVMMLLLHIGKPIELHDLLEAWSFEPGVVAGLGLTLGLYVAGIARRRGAGNAAYVKSHRVTEAFFVLGWLSLTIALVSPIHALGNALFSAHMVQHEILMLVAAPLLVLARPLDTFLWALSLRWRTAVGTITRAAAVKKVWHFVTNAWFVWTFHAVALWVWHIPRLFQATRTSEAVHSAQHLSFFVSALLFWWALLYTKGGRMGYGASVFFVFTTGLHSGVLGALLTFARLPWYPAYAESAQAWGLTALEDQQLAGLIMWVPAGCMYVIAGLWLFAAWLKLVDTRPELRRIAGVMLLLSGFVLTSCQRDNVARAAAEMTGGDPQRGRAAAREYGCASCHAIPGVAGADSQVGPSLEHMANRAYVAGMLPNTPGNMIQWLNDPRHVNPQTAMPKTVPDEAEARNIAAYLYTLQ